MNLTKLFNINYLRQNLKKSKVILLIFTLLIPILNTLALIMASINSNNYVPSLLDISVINIVGIYFLPLVISICLFNFMFKKKSVDFINSMPISRKSIFITNTIGGLLIFLVMLIVNALLICMVSLMFNIPIPFIMLLDYVLIWFSIYMFAFTIANLAMSISGNAITGIVVSLLLIFFVPFMLNYTNILKENNNSDNYYIEVKDENAIPENYTCSENDIECNLNKQLNKYEVYMTKVTDKKYNPMFNFIFGRMYEYDYEIEIYTNITIVLLSIIYIIVGYYLFINRKMEVSETSFKSIHLHNIVKSLTLLPFVAISYAICRDANILSILFVIIIMLIYYFIYDLITKKSITNIKLSLFYFVMAISIYTIIFAVCDINKEETTVINYNDITSLAVDFSTYGINNYARNNNQTDKIYIKDKELISKIIKSKLNDTYIDKEDTTNVELYIKLKDNSVYNLNVELNNNDYDELLDKLYNNKDYVKKYKDIDFDKVYAVKLGQKIYNKAESKDIVKLIKTTINNMSTEEFVRLQNKYRNVRNSNYYVIKLYSYTNHKTNEYVINGYINYDLLNSVVNSNNKLLKDNIDYILPKKYNIMYTNKYFIDGYKVINDCVTLAQEELYNFILQEINNTVDMKKEFISLNICFNDNCYDFTSNNTSRFKEILDTKKDKVASIYDSKKDTTDVENQDNDDYNDGELYEY